MTNNRQIEADESKKNRKRAAVRGYKRGDIMAPQPSAAPTALMLDQFAPGVAALLDANFDSSAYVKSALDGRADKTLAELESGLQLVSKELGERVSDKYETLLANVNATHGIEGKLLRSNERVEGLTLAVRRIEGQISRPYEALSTSLLQYERMLQSAELLAQVQRAMSQLKRLRDAMSPPARALPPPVSTVAAPKQPPPAGPPPARRADLPKAATALCELEGLLSGDVELRGVEVIDAELDFVQKSGVTLRAQARALLRAGIIEQSPTQVGAALQVFFNLKELPSAALGAASDIAADVAAAVAAAFDVPTFGADAAAKLAGGGGVLGDLGASNASRNGMPPVGAASGWRQLLWTRADGVGEAFYVACLRLADLQKVLTRKRDPLTHTLFASLLQASTDAATLADGASARPVGDGAEADGAQRWPGSEPALLASSPMLFSIVADVLGAIETRTSDGPATTDPFAPPATATPVNAPAGAPPAIASSDGLHALWAPLSATLQSALAKAMAGAPFVRHHIVSEPWRLLSMLMAAAERFEAHLMPTPITNEAYGALHADALCSCLRPATDAYQRQTLAALTAACDATLAAASAAASSAASGNAAGGVPAGGASHAEHKSLGPAIATEVQRTADTPPLQRIALGACATAVALFANRAEGRIELNAAHASHTNAELLLAVQSVRADVHAALDAHADAEGAHAVHAALAKLAPVLVALANPATPLPEAMRERATGMLKQLLRREMIDDHA